MNNKLKQEATQYFRGRSVLMALVNEFAAKYRSLGHFGGTATLAGLTEKEQGDLATFLRRKTSATERVSFKELNEVWQKTRFDALPLEEFLLTLLPAGFNSKKEERSARQKTWWAIYERLMANHSTETARKWLQALYDGSLRLSNRELYLQEDLLDKVANGLEHLPKEYERLPVFANRTTDNPHEFDFEQPAGRLLLQALAFLTGISVPVAADSRTDLLYQYHIIRDDILNFATVYGLAAYGKDGAEILYWRQAADTYSPLNIPLREIVLAERIESVGKNISTVYVVENSGVFSTLLDKLQEQQQMVPLIALHGQLKAASWALLDRLVQSGFKIRYGGDLDPEGIGIAQHILSRYDGAELWHMSVEEYGGAVIDVPDTRLKKLPSLVHPQLKTLVQEMQGRKKVLYQESLLAAMCKDILV